MAESWEGKFNRANKQALARKSARAKVSPKKPRADCRYLSVSCVYCGVEAGKACATPSGNPAGGWSAAHSARRAAWLKASHKPKRKSVSFDDWRAIEKRSGSGLPHFDLYSHSTKLTIELGPVMWSQAQIAVEVACEFESSGRIRELEKASKQPRGDNDSSAEFGFRTEKRFWVSDAVCDPMHCYTTPGRLEEADRFNITFTKRLTIAMDSLSCARESRSQIAVEAMEIGLRELERRQLLLDVEAAKAFKLPEPESPGDNKATIAEIVSALTPDLKPATPEVVESEDDHFNDILGKLQKTVAQGWAQR